MIEKINYGPQEKAECIQRMKDISTGIKSILRKVEWTDELVSALSVEQLCYLIKAVGCRLPGRES